MSQIPLFVPEPQQHSQDTSLLTPEQLFSTVEMPLISVLMQIEQKGVLIDSDFLEKLRARIQEMLKRVEASIISLAGKQFAINSPKQLSTVLFEDLGLKSKRKTKTGFSTDAQTLEAMHDEHPIISKLLEFRHLEKLLSTYIEPIPKMINSETGRLHTSYNQSVASTGRLSSVKPNLQNIPIRSELGNEIRKAFIAPEGYSIVSIDYSQIELRLVAHFAQDQQMIADFAAGKDIHTATAARLFKCKEEEVTKSQRRVAKAINFATIYGAGPRNLAQNSGVTVAEAKQFIETYFSTYHAVKSYIEFLKEQARKKGYAETLFGRRLPVPDIHTSNPPIRAGAERLAVNMPLQGTAADIIKRAMIRLQAFINKNFHDHAVTMILQVHDEIVFEVKDDLIETVTPELALIMQQGVTLRVPLVVDTSVGKSWGALGER